MNLLCLIYQSFLEVYSFSLHVTAFHIRLTSFVLLTSLSPCKGWMFHNSLNKSPPWTSYVRSIYIFPGNLYSALLCGPGQLNSQIDSRQSTHIQKSILNKSSFSESLYISNRNSCLDKHSSLCVYGHIPSCTWLHSIYELFSFCVSE